MLKKDPLSRTVKLHISCKGLQSSDRWTKSDPFVLCLRKKKKKWKIQGRTETVFDDCSPSFTKSIKMRFYFEEEQQLKFMVMDDDSSRFLSKNQEEVVEDFSDHEFIGIANFTLGSICTSNTHSITQPLKTEHGGFVGEITIKADIVGLETDLDKCHLKINGKNLKRMDYLSASDPYVKISKAMKDGYSLVYKSDTISNTSAPDFPKFTQTMGHFCGNDIDRKLLIQVIDYDELSEHDPIGSVTTTLREIRDKKELEITENKKVTGKLIFKTNVEYFYTVLDYINVGCKISFMAAIDFTDSNGDISDKKSLHYISKEEGKMNDYQLAISQVASILGNYDTNQEYAAFGFGAKLNKNDDEASPCFSLNGNEKKPFCTGVKGILEAYETIATKIEFSGPTLFAPVIRRAIALTDDKKQPPVYTILLLITDGIVIDTEETTEALIEASKKPISIIVVGVGKKSNFSSVKLFDSDKSMLKNEKGEEVERDVVQFVNFNKLQLKERGIDLSNKVLKEIPTQFKSYMKAQGLTPESIKNLKK